MSASIKTKIPATKTLTFENLANTNYSSSNSMSVGLNGNSSTITSASTSFSTGTSYERTKTLATLGQGNITITDKANSDDTDRLNRDTTKVDKALFKTTTGTSVDATLDTRLLSSGGHKQIADDIKTASTIGDSIVQIATTERAGAFDFFKETEKNVNVLNGMKNAIASDEKLAQQLSNPNLTPEQKQAMLGEVAKTVMVSLGYTPNETKIMYNDTAGEEGVAVKGHYSSETNTNYINDKYNDSTKELVSTTGHETQHAMDQQSNIQVTNKADNEQYSSNFGNTVADYTDYALGYNNKETMAQTNSHEGAMTLTTPNKTVNVITSPLLTKNNNEFAGVDKSLGEDDVLVPVNKRLSNPLDGDRYPQGTDKKGNDRKKAYTDLGFDPNIPYTKYDMLSLDFKNPKELEAALKNNGFNSIDDFRQAYVNNPNDPKVKAFTDKKLIGIAKNYTYESRQIENGKIGGDGTILGEDSGYRLVNNLGLLGQVTSKEHKLGISDDTPKAKSNKLLTDGDQDDRKGVDIHSGSCYASTGCVTSTSIPFSVPNHQKVADQLIKIAPSLKTPAKDKPYEPTYIYLPTKTDLQGGKK